MSSSRYRFVKRQDSTQVVQVEDSKSAEVLSGILGRLEPGEWIIQEEQVLGAPLGAPVEAARTASPSSVVPSAPMAAQPPAFKSPTLASLLPLSLSAAPERSPSPVVEIHRRTQAKRPDQRRFSRFNLEFKVVLVCQGKTFRTYSDNISIGGMHLKHKVPPFMLDHPCKIVISRRDSFENIEFQCRIISRGDDPQGVEFVEGDPKALQSLENWIQQDSLLSISQRKSTA